MKKRIKIFHIIHTLKIGGVETAALSSLETLNNYYDFRLLIIDKDFSKIEIPASIRPFVVIFGGKNPIDLVNYYKIGKYIQQEKPNIVISSLWRSVVAVILSKLIYKNFIWISFFHSTIFKHSWDKIFNKIGFKFANYILVDSKKAQEFVTQWVSIQKVSIISFLIQKNQILHNLKFKNLKMVYIGRINPMKGIEIGIKLQHYLLNHFNIEVPFDIYGPDEGNLETLKALSHDLGVVNFKYCGVLPPHKVSETLSQYTLFFQASEYEGMAMSVVEAMQQGLVCIVTPVGEIQNYTQHLSSAIHLNTQNDLSVQDSFKVIGNVLQDQFFLQKLSKNAKTQFINYPTYTESLLSFLQKK